MSNISKWRSPSSVHPRGTATLAVFVIFIILISALAAETFRQAYRRQMRTFQLVSSMATVKATASSIEFELSEALRMAIVASMYEGGILSENSELIEERVISYLNERIRYGWRYSGFKQISVSPVDENSLKFIWMPDGSLKASALVYSRLIHISGVEMVGLLVEIEVSPRYLRLHHLANLAQEMIETGVDPEFLERNLNENYACELIKFEISNDQIIIIDLYGGEILLN